MLESESGVEAVKRRGLSVIRTIVTEQSRLCGKRLSEVQFRETYKAAIVAVQKFDKSKVVDLTEMLFAPGDVLVLQANDDSPLLVRPPPGFYSQSENKVGYNPKVFFKAVANKFSSGDLKGKNDEDVGFDQSIVKGPGSLMDTNFLQSNSQLSYDVEIAPNGDFFIPDPESSGVEDSLKRKSHNANVGGEVSDTTDDCIANL